MNRPMTRCTNWYYIKPMFWFISEIMVIMSSCLKTYSASLRFRRRQFFVSYYVSDYFTSLNSFGIILTTYFAVFATYFSSPFGLNIYFLSDFSFFTIVIFFSGNSVIFCFLVSFVIFSTFFTYAIFVFTFFTRTTKTIFARFLFVKFSKWKNLLAFRALFCLNCISHSLISNIKFWSGPVSGYNPFLARLIIGRTP